MKLSTYITRGNKYYN